MGATTKIYTPKLNISINGKAMPVLSANVRGNLGMPSEGSVVVTTNEDVNGGLCTVSDILQMAAEVQTSSLNLTNSNKLVINMQSGNTSLNWEGYISNSFVSSSSRGGLMLSVTGIHKDAFIDAFDPSIYMLSAPSEEIKQKLQKEIFKSGLENKINIENIIPYPFLMKSASSLNASISERIKDMLTAAMSSFKSDNESVNIIHENNKASWSFVEDFLSNSNDSSRLLNGNAIIPDSNINNIINQGLAQIIFTSGSSLLNNIQDLGDFLGLYYSPSISTKSGKLMNYAYDPNGSKAGNIQGSLLNFEFSSAQVGISTTPIKQIKVSLANSNPNSTDLPIVAYPEKVESDTNGIVKTIEAPYWLVIPKTSLLDLQLNKNKPKNSISRIGDGGGEVLKLSEKAIDKAIEKQLINAVQFAKAQYYKYKLQGCAGSGTIYFEGNNNINLGQRYTFSSEGGGTIGNGVLTSIQHTMSVSNIQTSAGFKALLINGVSI